MKLFVDTAEVEAISDLWDIGIIDGVTTNPSLIMKSGRDIFPVLEEICTLVDGMPVSAEVVATEAEAMIAEGRRLARIAPNIVVKLPLTRDGLKACRQLAKVDNIKVNVTLCFSVNQALLAAKVGATYISPFIGRLDDIELNGMQLIEDIVRIYRNFDFRTEVLAASVRTVDHVRRAGLAGADVSTIPPALFEKMIRHPLTDTGLASFLADWEKTGSRIV